MPCQNLYSSFLSLPLVQLTATKVVRCSSPCQLILSRLLPEECVLIMVRCPTTPRSTVTCLFRPKAKRHCRVPSLSRSHSSMRASGCRLVCSSLSLSLSSSFSFNYYALLTEHRQPIRADGRLRWCHPCLRASFAPQPVVNSRHERHLLHPAKPRTVPESHRVPSDHHKAGSSERRILGKSW